MKKLPRFIAAAALAILLTVLLDHIFIPKYISENQDGSITREFYIQADRPEVIFLGASTVHYCISPDYLYKCSGITSYDRSNASQTLWQSYYLLKDTLTVSKPKLVALDVSFLKNGEEFIEEPSNRKVIEHMRDPVSKLGAVLSSAGDFEQPAGYFIPVLRYHSRWKDLKEEDFRYAFNAPCVTYDGYLMDSSIPEEQHIYEPEPIDDPSFAPKAEEYLDRIIELCKNEGIELLLMKTPTFVNSWHTEYDEALEKKAGSNGIRYINFSPLADEMGIRVRTDYIDDGEHMNISGAHKFTEYLGEYINNNYAPASDEDEVLKKKWSEKLGAYEKAAAEGMAAWEKAYEKYADGAE
ncbi:MAG: SGNH/GDSL hydrolase family protein [Lachnospiraceae bacterium]|nr:SGNH/GDSL hydrolase family protein [Lachnospiraceae bacterium]